MERHVTRNEHLESLALQNLDVVLGECIHVLDFHGLIDGHRVVGPSIARRNRDRSERRPELIAVVNVIVGEVEFSWEGV